MTGAEGECRVPNFPAPGETMPFAWNEATQHLEMVGGEDGDPPLGTGGICDRTPAAREAILSKLGRTDCAAVTAPMLNTLSGFLHVGSEPALQPGDFAGLTNLRELRVGARQQTMLMPGVFAGLTNLHTLWLSESYLTTLPPGVFTGLAHLQYVDLGRNHLMTLPSGVFAGLDDLKGINLDVNRLTSLPSDVFRGLTTLEGLELSGNQLVTLPPDLFQGLTNLTYLALRDNQLHTLPPGLFADLPSNARISLEGNPGYPFSTDSGGGGDCEAAWTGPETTIQITSQCTLACIYAAAGQEEGREAACSILHQWERHEPGTVLRYCPVCQ